MERRDSETLTMKVLNWKQSETEYKEIKLDEYNPPLGYNVYTYLPVSDTERGTKGQREHEKKSEMQKKH